MSSSDENLPLPSDDEANRNETASGTSEIDSSPNANRQNAENQTFNPPRNRFSEDQRLNGILQHLIRTGQVPLISEENNEHGRSSSDEENDEEDDGPMLNWQEAIQETDSLMMGPGRQNMACCTRSSCASKQQEKSTLNSSDIKTEISLATGQFYQKPKQRSSLNLGEKIRTNQLSGRLRQREHGMLPYFPKSSCSAATGTLTSGDRCFLNHHFLPNKKQVVARHRTKTFCCDFTDGGDTLITASQDHLIRFYRRSGDTFKEFRNLEARDVGWSILDFSVSPDGRHLIYGTWSEYIHEFELHGDHLERFQAYGLDTTEYRFCVFSLRFSADGEQILAGASDRHIYVYNREAKQLNLKIKAHDDDINAVCFGDKGSNMVYSGGDDGLCKVWDRRTLREENPNPVGTLAGHMDGITFIDSKGDGRYLLTNSKDQSIKLWDIRKFSTHSAAEATKRAVAKQCWDYRWQSVPNRARRHKRLEGDTSVMTYRGHSVLHTLMRAYFSPQFSTGQRYIYAGCARGGFLIYDLLTGEVVSQLTGHMGCVRDVSWHPYKNLICSSSWDGSTAVWHYDERKKRNVNPEAPMNSEVIGDEDTSDEEGRKFSKRRRSADSDTIGMFNGVPMRTRTSGRQGLVSRLLDAWRGGGTVESSDEDMR